MKKSVFIVSILVTSLFSAENLDMVDCLILEDENSIVCKYAPNDVKSYDRNVTVDWVSPSGEVSRTREIELPSNHASIYDFRYIKGREKGEWIFKVYDEKEEYTTTFILE